LLASSETTGTDTSRMRSEVLPSSARRAPRRSACVRALQTPSCLRYELTGLDASYWRIERRPRHREASSTEPYRRMDEPLGSAKRSWPWFPLITVPPPGSRPRVHDVSGRGQHAVWVDQALQRKDAGGIPHVQYRHKGYFAVRHRPAAYYLRLTSLASLPGHGPGGGVARIQRYPAPSPFCSSAWTGCPIAALLRPARHRALPASRHRRSLFDPLCIAISHASLLRLLSWNSFLQAIHLLFHLPSRGGYGVLQSGSSVASSRFLNTSFDKWRVRGTRHLSAVSNMPQRNVKRPTIIPQRNRIERADGRSVMDFRSLRLFSAAREVGATTLPYRSSLPVPRGSAGLRPIRELVDGTGGWWTVGQAR